MANNIFEKHRKEIEAMMPDLIIELTVEARNFIDESWDNQGFTDVTLSPWKKSFEKDGSEKEKTLVETGALRRSPRTHTTPSEGIVYTELPYAQIHNEGGEIKTTATIREHTRKSKKGKSKVKSHTRNVNITMPKRQFMGESKTLDERSEKIIFDNLDRIFSK